MFMEILESCISAIVEGLEDFFNIITYPSRKYIKTAIFIACGFLVVSVAGLGLGMFIFVQWYEALTAIIILTIIYYVSDLTTKQVTNAANAMMIKTSKTVSNAKKQLIASSKSVKSSKKSVSKKPKSKRR